MIPILVLLVLLALFGGLGFGLHLLWWILIALVVLWVLGFFVGGPAGGRRGYWGRW